MKRKDNATFIGKDGIERFRQPVNCISRCMGYLRGWLVPTQSIKGGDVVTDKNKNIQIFGNGFNVGKRSEYASRNRFVEGKTCPRNFDKVDSMIKTNQDFILKYS